MHRIQQEWIHNWRAFCTWQLKASQELHLSFFIECLFSASKDNSSNLVLYSPLSPIRHQRPCNKVAYLNLAPMRQLYSIRMAAFLKYSFIKRWFIRLICMSCILFFIWELESCFSIHDCSQLHFWKKLWSYHHRDEPATFPHHTWSQQKTPYQLIGSI